MSIRGTKPQEVQWAVERLGYPIPSPFHGISFEENDELQAIAFFYHWTVNDVELALAARKVSRTFLRTLHHFMTDTLKVSRITLKVRVGSEAFNICNRLGAEFEGTQKFFYDDGTDALIFRLDSQNFKFK